MTLSRLRGWIRNLKAGYADSFDDHRRGLMIEIAELDSSHDRSSFSSGNAKLDKFFRASAGQNQRKGVSKTYVALIPPAIPIGYATVTAGQIESLDLPKDLQRRFPKYPLPVLRLGRIAVDENHQRQGVGTRLMRTVMNQALMMQNVVGCVGILVDAKPGSVDYYESLGFVVLELADDDANNPELTLMFLPLDTARRALSTAE